ncbi:unnamed protein product [Strongylus vulgaris]|uniref:Aspartate/ornithine carbamoyltransferase Asp/Orn-binding domain-containing protein n=1 Tax=Strongylus vulgaris TaxID=40348 RepID=A0A3P7IZH3_STRVU|nr:unnamed protein product [Strongylus vulgaris]
MAITDASILAHNSMHGCFTFLPQRKIFHSLPEGIQNVDVVYVTRIQKERFAKEVRTGGISTTYQVFNIGLSVLSFTSYVFCISKEDYNKVKGSYILTAKLLNAAARPQEFGGNILGPSRNLPIVLHPLPRVDEISTELDHDDRAAYFRQAKNGMFVRMAIIAMLLGKAPI